MFGFKKFALKFKINDKIVYICAFALTASFCLLFYKYFLSYMVTDLSFLLLQKTDLEKQLEIKNYNLNALAENLALIKELQKNAAPRQIPAQYETDAILNILRLIEEYELTESNFKILPREYTNESRYLRPIQFNASGAYRNCMLFLYAIQHEEYYCLPDKIEMYSQDMDYGKVHMSVCVYLIIENNLESGSVNGFDSGYFNKKDVANENNPFYYAE